MSWPPAMARPEAGKASRARRESDRAANAPQESGGRSPAPRRFRPALASDPRPRRRCVRWSTAFEELARAPGNPRPVELQDGIPLALTDELGITVRPVC